MNKPEILIKKFMLKWVIRMVNIYATDLKEEKQSDSFMGIGFEDALRKAKEKDKELIIGEYCKNNEWKEE